MFSGCASSYDILVFVAYLQIAVLVLFPTRYSRAIRLAPKDLIIIFLTEKIFDTHYETDVLLD